MYRKSQDPSAFLRRTRVAWATKPLKPASAKWWVNRTTDRPLSSEYAVEPARDSPEGR